MFFSAKVTRSIFYMLTLFVVAGVLASFSFFSWQSHLVVFFLLLEYSILFLSVLCFRVNYANFKYYLSQGLIALPCFVLLYIKKFKADPGLGFNDTFVFLGVAYFGALLFALFFCMLNYFGRPKTKGKKKELFLQRIVDLEKIEHYLDKFNIVGVDAKWGDGKTFLFETLEKKLKDKYHYSRIGVLSTTCDSIEKIIISEIHGMLRKEGIFSRATIKWNGFVDQSFMHKVNNFLSFDSYTEIVKQLLDDVVKLEKPIVISFEDIDRIQSPEVLYKIFAIVDAISCDKVKVLYQYDEEELVKLLSRKENDEGFVKFYMEKYIPHYLSLQKIPLYQIVDSLLKSGNYKRVEIEHFNFLKSKRIQVDELFWGTGPETKNPKGFDVGGVLDRVSIRRVELFLIEVDAVLLAGQGDSRAIIGLFMAKFFLPDVYKCLDNDLDLEEIPFFDDNKNLTTMLSNDGSNKIVTSDNDKVEFDTIRFFVSNRDKHATPVNSNAFLFFKLVGFDLRTVLYKNVGLFDPKEDSKFGKAKEKNNFIQRTIRYWKGRDYKLDLDNQELLKWLRKLFFGKSLTLQKKAFEKLILIFPPRYVDMPFQDIYDKLKLCDCTYSELKELFDFAKSYYHGEVASLLNQIDSDVLQKDESFCAYYLDSIVEAFPMESLHLKRGYWWLVSSVFYMLEFKYGFSLSYDDDSLDNVDSESAELAHSVDIHLPWFEKIFEWFEKNPSAVNRECITKFLQQARQFLPPSGPVK